MLKQRIITASVLAPLAVAAVVWLPTAALAFVAGGVFVLGYDEWTQLSGFRHAGHRLASALLLIVLLTGIFISGIKNSLPALLCIALAWWLLAALWLRHRHFASAVGGSRGLLKLLFGLLAIVPAWTALLWLHDYSPHGIWLLVALLVVWAADIGAYIAGSLFGHRKLAPSISPGKTWAGVYGALALSLLVMLVAALLMQIDMKLLILLLGCTVIAVAASVLGDLLESLLKRQAGIKDSGSIFPGHGGLLDRIDSVCALMPVFAAGVWWIAP